jgi:hypothetical protein
VRPARLVVDSLIITSLVNVPGGTLTVVTRPELTPSLG